MKNKVKENLPLKNIKVLDVSSFIAAPLTSAIMSDYGAEVIKIESPLGDSYRNACIGGQVWPESKLDWAFLLENRNKRSLSVDLKTDEGQIILKKLFVIHAGEHEFKLHENITAFPMKNIQSIFDAVNS